MKGVDKPVTGRPEREVEVTCYPDGPFLVRGADIIRDEQGIAHEVTRPVVAVCRCGKTSRAPWCDGTHKALNRRRAADATTSSEEPLTSAPTPP